MNVEVKPKAELPAQLGFVLGVIVFTETGDGVMRLREQGDLFQGIERSASVR